MQKHNHAQTIILRQDETGLDKTQNQNLNIYHMTNRVTTLSPFLTGVFTASLVWSLGLGLFLATTLYSSSSFNHNGGENYSNCQRYLTRGEDVDELDESNIDNKEHVNKKEEHKQNIHEQEEKEAIDNKEKDSLNNNDQQYSHEHKGTSTTTTTNNDISMPISMNSDDIVDENQAYNEDYIIRKSIDLWNSIKNRVEEESRKRIRWPWESLRRHLYLRTSSSTLQHGNLGLDTESKSLFPTISACQISAMDNTANSDSGNIDTTNSFESLHSPNISPRNVDNMNGYGEMNDFKVNEDPLYHVHHASSPLNANNATAPIDSPHQSPTSFQTSRLSPSPNTNGRYRSNTITNPMESNHHRGEKSGLCIGSIFGLDVGGTLAKFVYFEKSRSNIRAKRGRRSTLLFPHASIALNHSENGGDSKVSSKCNNKTEDHYQNNVAPDHTTPLHLLSHSRKLKHYSQSLEIQSQTQNYAFHRENSTHNHSSSVDFGHLNLSISVPTNLKSFADENDISSSSVPTEELNSNEYNGNEHNDTNGTENESEDVNDTDNNHRHTNNHHNLVYKRKKRARTFSEDNLKCNYNMVKDSEFSRQSQPSTIMPILFNDATIFTTKKHFKKNNMIRSKSMFNISKTAEHAEALDRFYNFVRRLDSYEMGVKEKSLSFFSRALGGEFHFIQFETRHMELAMDLIRSNHLHMNIVHMGATGGGAHKFASEWERVLGIKMSKQDELDSLVAGMQFVLSDVVGECYTFKPDIPLHDTENQGKSNNEREANNNKKDIPKRSSVESADSDIYTKDGTIKNIRSNVVKTKVPRQNLWSRKVKRDVATKSDAYPYMLVIIGTGVSVLRVDGPRKHERISGSTIGGGTYWGLCRLLTDVEDFESVLGLAERGDPSKVDMMVGDIYGENSDALEKLGLPADIVASSFGKLVAKRDPAAGLKQEDLARALLLMVTNNIGQVAYLNAQLHNTKRIYFAGNFLRHNVISQQRLAYAINYWSQGKMEALFLEHEGYYGALGAFLLNNEIKLETGKEARQRKMKLMPYTHNVKENYVPIKKRSTSF